MDALWIKTVYRCERGNNLYMQRGAAVLLTIAILLSTKVLAQIEDKSRQQEIRVEWYQPEVQSNPKKGRAKVVLSGQTSPAAQIGIDGQSITVILKNELPPSSTRKLGQTCPIFKKPDSSSDRIGKIKAGTEVQTKPKNKNSLKMKSLQ